MADANFQRGMLGTASYRHFPVWGEMAGNRLVQIITYHELQQYPDVDAAVIPEALKGLKEESNPVFIFYSL
ncbi:MAG: hypothetical protein LBB84_00805 [Tannerellaceae bacterium]|jgi:hypothetical protein|nr:hypothetical protein [Tannerellaceae bacterium]